MESYRRRPLQATPIPLTQTACSLAVLGRVTLIDDFTVSAVCLAEKTNVISLSFLPKYFLGGRSATHSGP